LFLSAAHTPRDVDRIVAAAREAMQEVKSDRDEFRSARSVGRK
jgi:hypothetical protein